MPASTVERDHGVRTHSDLCADLLEMQMHGLSVDVGQDQRCSNPAGGTHSTEDVGPCVALIPRCPRAAARFCPDIGQAALLADPGFILT